MCRSAGGAFARRPATSDICHHPSEVRRHYVHIRFSDSTSLVHDPSAGWRPADAANRRSEVLAVRCTKRSGSADAAEHRRSEDNLQSVYARLIATAVDASVAQSIDSGANAVWPACHAPTFTARRSNDDPSSFYYCGSRSSPGSLHSNRQKSAFQPICCNTRSCPTR